MKPAKSQIREYGEMPDALAEPLSVSIAVKISEDGDPEFYVSSVSPRNVRITLINEKLT